MTSIAPPSSLAPDTRESLPSASRLRFLLNRLQPSPETVVLLLAVVIGSGTGMGVVTFHYLIELIHHLALEDLMGAIAPWGAWTLAFVPILGGLIVGLMRWRWRDFGPGMSSLIAAAQAEDNASPVPLRPVLKMVAAAVSLGTGASLGPEGPSVEIGANFGVLLGRILQVSRERQRLLLGAGAAAGLAAGFNAPIAGVFFALEVVLGTTFATSAVSVVLLSAVVSALIAQIGLGAQPAFTLPVYEVRSPLELPLYLGLGVCASLVSIAYTRAIKAAQAFCQGRIPGWEWLGQIPASVRPVIGGAIVGVFALGWPQILGIGYETVEAMLRDVPFPLAVLVSLLVVKLVMTAISLGSGLVGGVFAPAMFLGASLGAAYGKVAAGLLVSHHIAIAASPAYAMVGMAAVLAGSVRAPLTAILLLFELTRDYRIVLPLMAAVGLTVWLVDSLQSAAAKGGLNLQQMGMNVEADHNSELLRRILVEEAMHPVTLTLSSSLSVLEAGRSLIQSAARSALVMDEANQLVGIITLQDITRILAKTEAQTEPEMGELQKLGDLCTTELVYAYRDESVAEALDRMATRGLHQLPVVERVQPDQVLGLLEQEGVSLACNVAATRQVLHRHLMVKSTAEQVSISA